MEVKFKAIAGKEDQAAGFIWRAKDSNNYYVARANAFEDNVATTTPVRPGAAATFTGEVRVEMRFEALDPSHASGTVSRLARGETLT